MGKKRRILLAALLVILLGGLAWWLLRPREPSYQGKPLSVWLEVYGQDYVAVQDADEAVRHIGTNAIPILLQMLRTKDSPLKTKSIEFFDRQDLVRIKITPAWERHYEAFRAFDILGAQATYAVPELVEIYGEKISPESQCATAASIGGVGPAAKSAVPSLLSGLKNTNDAVRYCTAMALGKIHAEPQLVVPELVKLLHDSKPMVSMLSAQALGEFRINAESAVPDLTALLNDPNRGIREAATNALKQIDPAAAAKAGVR